MPQKPYPVVLRFEGMSPGDLAGYEAHRLRKGGDLGHVNRRRTARNTRPIGGEAWAREAALEIAEMRMEMFAAELEYLERRKDRQAIRRRRIEGPKDPWRASRHGPLREVILTASRDWFEETEDATIIFDIEEQERREGAFEALAISWLKANFGDDVIHARCDRDEQAFHIHAVILPRAKVTKYGTECRMLQPSIHPMIRDYETAQDSVGEWFAAAGLVRGERRKQAIREALASGKAPPAQRRHVRPAKWREQEELRLARKEAEVETRRRAVAGREREAGEVIDFADAVAEGRIDAAGREIGPGADGTPSAPRLPPERKATAGFARARKAFRTAFDRLRGQARQEADQAAEARLASEIAEIRRADEVILEIARLLPAGLRTRIAEVRRALTARIMRLDPGARQRHTPMQTTRNDRRNERE